MRLALEPRVGDAAVAVEAEHRLGRLHLQRAAREAACAQRGRELVVQCELIEDQLGRLAPLRLPVGQARVRADDRAVERRLAMRRDLDRHAEAVHVRAKRAEVVGELVRQHRRDGTGHVGRERPARGAVVERRARADEPGDVGDVHPRADSVGFAPERERVVEVLRGIGIDGVGRQVAQVDAVRILGRRRIVRLERLPGAALDEERLEDVLDPVRRPERLLDAARALSPAARPPGRRARGRRAPSTRARAARPA